jgi:hypothetical protein
MPITWKRVLEHSQVIVTFAILCDACGREIHLSEGDGNVLLRDFTSGGPGGSVVFACKGACDRTLDPPPCNAGWNAAKAFVLYLARNFYRGTGAQIVVKEENARRRSGSNAR